MEENKWIDVNDKRQIREVNKEYLVAYKMSSNPDSSAKVTTAILCESHDSYGKEITYWANPETFEPFMYITHYAEIPSPPTTKS